VFLNDLLNVPSEREIDLSIDLSQIRNLYHPRKANVVTDALCRLSMDNVAHINDDKKEIIRDVHCLAHLGVRLMESTKGCVMVHNGSESSFVSDVKAKQYLHPTLVGLKETVLKKSIESFSLGEDGVFRYQGLLCVPNVDYLREQILAEAHSSRYSIHPRATNMYRNLWEVYWWNAMKKYIAEFVGKCSNGHQVKVEHQMP